MADRAVFIFDLLLVVDIVVFDFDFLFYGVVFVFSVERPKLTPGLTRVEHDSILLAARGRI